jgi:hypothetical protein
MDEYLNKVKNEVKRVDHLFFVSLKYTRTVDVIRSVIDRMINALGFGIDALLEKAKKTKIPPSPRLRAELARELYASDKKLIDFIEFYILLRKIIKAKYTKKEEYRRHVAMITEIAPESYLEVNIDLLNEYYTKIKDFVEYLQELLK